MPFALTNLAVAQLKLPLLQVVFFSWLGLLPRSIFAAIAGTSIKSVVDAYKIHIDYKVASLVTILAMSYIGWKAFRLWKENQADNLSANYAPQTERL